MARTYYSDRVAGPAPRQIEEITLPAWGGIVSIVRRGLAYPLFAEDFPEMCPDDKGPYACNEHDFSLALGADLPALSWPLSEGSVPPTLAVLDLLEFLYEHASAPIEGSYHKFFDHRHLSFDKQRGQRELRDQVNRLLARNGIAFELTSDGSIERLAPPGVRVQLRRELPDTRDAELDDLVEAAVTKYLSPDPRERRDGLEKLWDAFERMKTILDVDKKRGAGALVTAATDGSPEEADLVETEMRELTGIGNGFRIRHHETDKPKPSDDMVDHVFGRMYALIYRVHPALR